MYKHAHTDQGTAIHSLENLSGALMYMLLFYSDVLDDRHFYH